MMSRRRRFNHEEWCAPKITWLTSLLMMRRSGDEVNRGFCDLDSCSQILASQEMAQMEPDPGRIRVAGVS